jgi:hypothetical protein
MTVQCTTCNQSIEVKNDVIRCNCGRVYRVNLTIEKWTPPAKRRTQAQIRASQNRSDRYQRAVRDMIDHILDKIEQGYYTIQEFINDPSSYFDPEVMGKEYANQFARKSVIKQISVKADECPW